MHSGGHGQTLRREAQEIRQRLSIQGNPNSAEGHTRNHGRPVLGKARPRTRQTLTTAQVFPPQEKQIILIPLLTPRRLLLI